MGRIKAMVDGTEMPQDRPLEEDEANKAADAVQVRCVCSFTVDASRGDVHRAGQTTSLRSGAADGGEVWK